MKKIFKYFTFCLFSFLIIGVVKAESIYSIKMDIYIDSNGDANVTEVWDTDATEKTEYYHAFYNIGNSKITDLKVKDEEKEYELVDWDVDASFSTKAYKYGYNYTNNGVELCFGKSSYKKHTYTLTYKIKSFVSRVDDADIIYWNLLDSMKPVPGNVEIVMHADEAFSDDLDVWGYGNYGGLAYVADGKIYLSNDSLSSSDYMVALVKFPLNTFNTTNTLDGNFDDYFKRAEEGADHYKESNDDGFTIMMIIFQVLFWFSFIFGISKYSQNQGLKSGSKVLYYGSTGRKIPKDVPLFRDIPCGKDIYKAYWIAYNYKLMKKQTDFLGVILLKWLKEDKIKIENKTVNGIFKKEDTSIIFSSQNLESEIDLENKLYNYMYEASKDGILESKEFEKWCSKHYTKILNWFNDVLDYENEKLIEAGKLTKTVKTSLKIFKSVVYEVDPSMMDEAKQMAGLKQFFKEFGSIESKEAIEVKLWEYYLMYAQIFGVAKKVAKQFKELYPDVITDYSYESVNFIYAISYSGMSSASSARSRAESYSSGGGGFSSGGGGGGSFGGGGGGSR